MFDVDFDGDGHLDGFDDHGHAGLFEGGHHGDGGFIHDVIDVIDGLDGDWHGSHGGHDFVHSGVHIASHGHGHCGFHSHFGMGLVGHALGTAHFDCTKYPDQCTPEWCEQNAHRRTKLPGLVMPKDRAQIQALIWPHGRVKDTRAIFTELASRHNLFDITMIKQGLSPFSQMAETIEDTTPFDGFSHNTPMPSGWVRGAKGFTVTWQRYFQLGEKPYIWSWWKAPNLEKPTYITVRCTTWYYDGFADYETRMIATTKIAKFWRGNQWNYHTKDIRGHMLAAARTVQGFFDIVRQHKPGPFSDSARRIQAEAEAERLAQALRQSEEKAAALAANPPAQGASVPQQGNPLLVGLSNGADAIAVDMDCQAG